MLKKKLGIEVVERKWYWDMRPQLFFKIPSTLIIPEGCVKIGIWAFVGYKNLKKVVISKSVMEIGEGAFEKCREATIILKKPKKDFVRIGSDAFIDCKDVKEDIWY